MNEAWSDMQSGAISRCDKCQTLFGDDNCPVCEERENNQAIKDSDIKEFKKHAKALRRLILKIRGYCPKANYYLAMESLHLLYEEMETPSGGGLSYDLNAHKIVATESLGVAGGGDW